MSWVRRFLKFASGLRNKKMRNLLKINKLRTIHLKVPGQNRDKNIQSHGSPDK